MIDFLINGFQIMTRDGKVFKKKHSTQTVLEKKVKDTVIRDSVRIAIVARCEDLSNHYTMGATFLHI